MRFTKEELALLADGVRSVLGELAHDVSSNRRETIARAQDLVVRLDAERKRPAFERVVELTPAYDHVNEKPGGGCHGVELRMVLVGPFAATQFVVYTNWMLPETRKRLDAMEPSVEARLKRELGPFYQRSAHALCRPMPADVGYHALVPHYDEQSPRADCPYLDGKPCYYDGSGCRADEEAFPILLREGSEGVWRFLEREYERVAAQHEEGLARLRALK